MTRGYSLEQDLRLLINNPKYSDIEILCEDEKRLHGCPIKNKCPENVIKNVWKMSGINLMCPENVHFFGTCLTHF